MARRDNQLSDSKENQAAIHDRCTYPKKSEINWTRPQNGARTPLLAAEDDASKSG